MGLDYVLPAATSPDEHDRAAKVAVLPVGSFEQHGSHLPLATDTLIACAITRAIAGRYPVLALPPVTVSCSHEHQAWAGTVSISATTLHAIVTDIWDSLRRSGISKLVIVSGHGGNYVLRNVVQEASVTGPDMAFYPAGGDWARARAAAGMVTSDHDDMHAGELETSILLHLSPEIVRDSYQLADHIAGKRDDLLTLGMAEYTTTGVIGRPSFATAAKGAAALDSLANSFRHCLDALGTSTPD